MTKNRRHTIKTIVHIPHSSTHIPDRASSQFVLRTSALQQELNLLTDWFTMAALGMDVDAYHTPASLHDAAVELFKQAGFTTAINQPFAGAMVAQGFYQVDKRVVALMIEVRRDLYMDERNIEKLAIFGTVRRRIRNVILDILNFDWY